jgi:hypothetical protein
MFAGRLKGPQLLGGPAMMIRTRVLRDCIALVAFALALCWHPRCALAAKPSNADTAFRQVPLNPPSSGSGYVPNSGHGQWPLSLENPALIWPIGGVDSVLIASTRLQGVRINLDGSVTYSLPPNTRANRIAVIVTANDGTDPFDYNFPLLFVSCTFGDGRTWGSTSLPGLFNTYDLAFGHDVRNWSNQVSPSQPLFVAKPPAPTTFEVFAGPGISGPDSVFFDIQTIDIPDTLRSATLSTMTFTSSSFFTTTTGLISGLAVWPDFQIANRHGFDLGLQMQTDPTYSARAYGGYVLRDTLFGTSKTINANGCMLSCMAMANTFFGDSVTVPVLNEYLVRHRGYDRVDAAVIDGVLGQDVGDMVLWHAVGNRNIRAGDSLLIEASPRDPVVTLRASSSSSGTIVRRHRSGVIVSGARAAVYGLINTTVASSEFANSMGRPWSLTPLGNSAGTPLLVETALVDSLPVL